jgi:hypothetical protein
MRRPLFAALSAALILMISVPAFASAAPVTRFHDHAVSIDCFLSNDDGVVGAFATNSTEFGATGDLAFWQAPADPDTSDPTLVTVAADVTGTDSTLSADFTLVNLASGDPGGTAELRVDLTPSGPPEPVNDRFKDGNRWQRVSGTTQPLSVTGTLDVPGAATFDASACFARIDDIDFAASNPSAFIERFDNFFLSCSWETADGFVDMFANADTFGAAADIFVSDASGEYSGFNDATLTTTAFDAAWELFLENGNSAVGTASASATLASTGEVIRTKDGSPPNFGMFTSQPFSVDGSLSLTTPGGSQTLPMDADHCNAAQEHAFFHSVQPAGPKPKPLANDAPTGAVAAKFGKTIRVVTGGNAQAPEEPCTVTDPETNETFELPIEYTAWWTFTGTGGQVTADSAGSSFDTIVGVYTGTPGSLTQVGCVDDVDDPTFSLQAKVTVDTIAGATYFVQAGGFGGSTGRLQLVVRKGT